MSLIDLVALTTPIWWPDMLSDAIYSAATGHGACYTDWKRAVEGSNV